MLRIILLLAINGYWLVAPVLVKKKCIYKVSCSRYVYDITYKFGFFKGAKALIRRWQTCRPGYRIVFSKQKFKICFANGVWGDTKDISDHILKPYKEDLEKTENRLYTKYNTNILI